MRGKRQETLLLQVLPALGGGKGKEEEEQEEGGSRRMRWGEPQDSPQPPQARDLSCEDPHPLPTLLLYAICKFSHSSSSTSFFVVSSRHWCSALWMGPVRSSWP